MVDLLEAPRAPAVVWGPATGTDNANAVGSRGRGLGPCLMARGGDVTSELTYGGALVAAARARRGPGGRGYLSRRGGGRVGDVLVRQRLVRALGELQGPEDQRADDRDGQIDH